MSVGKKERNKQTNKNVEFTRCITRFISVLFIFFRLEVEDVTGSWSKLNNEKLYDFYSSPNMNRTAI